MNEKLDYQRPIEIGKGVFWIGFCDSETGLHCNPYLIIDGEESVVIDGGSRPDFPNVMMKILRTGVKPRSIQALIYQHYDPDLCGSLPNFENIITNKNMRVLSTSENHMFISHYSVKSNIVNLDQISFEYQFSSGRKLKFFKTPYAHAPGSFVTWDEKSGILFTSDLFGSFIKNWNLFAKIEEKCNNCRLDNLCVSDPRLCPIHGILAFHRTIFPTVRVLKYAMEVIEKIDFKLIAPQHGSVLEREPALFIIDRLKNLENVGIDAVFKEKQE